MIGEKKKCIGLIFGGYSNEHEVSISSAKTVFQAFNSGTNKQRFTVKPFYINKFGDWLDNDISEKILIGEIENAKTKKQVTFNYDKINFLDGIDFQNVDIWFPLLHGFNGEDGSIHGLLKFTKKPLVGCGILGSALGMDKILMKTIFSNLKLPQVKYLVFQNEDLHNELVKKKIISEIKKKLNFPVFVKPSNSGSSLGISKVINESEILQALEKAWKIDPRILVEEGLEVREIECGIIGKTKLFTSEIGEVRYEGDWYDYDSKYNKNNKYLFPSINSKHKSFEEKRYWRGPVWINCNWIIYQGLKNKDKKFAETIRKKTLNLVEKKKFREYYSCKSGLGMGAKNFSWTAALYLDFKLNSY